MFDDLMMPWSRARVVSISIAQPMDMEVALTWILYLRLAHLNLLIVAFQIFSPKSLVQGFSQKSSIQSLQFKVLSPN